MADGARDEDIQSVDDVRTRVCCRCMKHKAICPGNDILIRTVCLSIAYFIQGIGGTLLGATVVHLERLFDTDTATIGLVFPVTSIGGLIGSVACGVVYDRIVKYRELTFSLLNFLSSVAIIIAPFVGDLGGLPAFIALVFIWMIPRGYFFTSCSSYSVNMWEGHWLRDSVVQGTFSLWSLGATVGPMIIKNFLVELPAPYTTVIPTFNGSSSSYTSPGMFEVTAGEITATAAVTDEISSVDVSAVKFAFVVVGTLDAWTALMFLAIQIFSKKPSLQQDSAQEQQQQQQQSEKQCKEGANDGRASVSTSGTECVEKSSGANTEVSRDTSSSSFDEGDSKQPGEPSKARYRRLYVSFLVLLFLFYNFQMFFEEVFMSYLTSFAIKYTGWSVKAGSDVMALYYACQFGAIVLGVPISAVVSPQIILIVDQIIMTVACLLLLLVDVWPDVLWLSAALAGFGTACSFAGMILWLSNTITFTGLVSAVAMFGIATGSIIAPTIVGQLFDTVTPLAFVYMLIGSVFAVAVTLAVIFAFDRRYNEELKLGVDGIDSLNGGLSIQSSSDATIDVDKTVLVTYF